MKTITLPVAAMIAALSLAGCQSEPEVVDTRPRNPLEAELRNAPAVELPPAITAQVTFRCRDNSLAYVEFFQGSEQVTVRSEQDGARTVLRAPAAGEAFVADGYSLTGDPQNITLTQPGKPEQTCRA